MTDILKIKDNQGNWQTISAITGPKGDKGDKGDKGEKGDPGQGAVGIQTGEGVPTTSTSGVLGELYIDTLTGKRYRLYNIDTSVSPTQYDWENDPTNVIHVTDPDLDLMSASFGIETDTTAAGLDVDSEGIVMGSADENGNISMLGISNSSGGPYLLHAHESEYPVEYPVAGNLVLEDSVVPDETTPAPVGSMITVDTGGTPITYMCTGRDATDPQNITYTWKKVGGGVPSGGSIGQILVKQSNQDGDVSWTDDLSRKLEIYSEGEGFGPYNLPTDPDAPLIVTRYDELTTLYPTEVIRLGTFAGGGDVFGDEFLKAFGADLVRNNVDIAGGEWVVHTGDSEGSQADMEDSFFSMAIMGQSSGSVAIIIIMVHGFILNGLEQPTEYSRTFYVQYTDSTPSSLVVIQDTKESWPDFPVTNNIPNIYYSLYVPYCASMFSGMENLTDPDVIDTINHCFSISPPGGGGGSVRIDTAEKLRDWTLQAVLDKIYPIGSIYMSANLSTPDQVSDIIGGYWSSWGSGRVPVGVDASQTEFQATNQTGGEKTHTLTTQEMPSHTHGLYGALTGETKAITNTGNDWAQTTTGWTADYIKEAGGGKAHNNLQPYITCYMYKRVSDPVIAQSMTIATTAQQLWQGDTAQLTPMFVPEGVTSKKVVWSAPDTTYINVDENGLVTCHKDKGTGAVAYVYATAQDGSGVQGSIALDIGGIA